MTEYEKEMTLRAARALTCAAAVYRDVPEARGYHWINGWTDRDLDKLAVSLRQIAREHKGAA